MFFGISISNFCFYLYVYLGTFHSKCTLFYVLILILLVRFHLRDTLL